MKKIKDSITSFIKQCVHEELLDQLEGLINIELGTYIYNMEEQNNFKHFTKDSLEIFVDRGGNGLDVYVKPMRKIHIDEYDKYMVGHYHSDDLLYLILNWEKEKQFMIDGASVIFFDYYFCR